MTAGLELAAQLAVVVNFAVEDDPDRARLVVHRLPAARQIDDAEAPHAEGEPRLNVHAFVVGSPVADHVAHPVDEGEFRLETRRRLLAAAARRRIREACYPAHRRSSVSLSFSALAWCLRGRSRLRHMHG